MARSPFEGEPRDRRDAPPRRAGEVIRTLLTDRRMARGLALGRLVRGWSEVVGEDLAAHAVPASLEAGELAIATTGNEWAAQVRFLEATIAERANAVMGSAEVRRIRVVVVPRRAGR